MLTDYCLEVCHRWCVQRVTTETSPENRRMLDIFSHLGFKLLSHSDTVFVAKDLSRLAIAYIVNGLIAQLMNKVNAAGRTALPARTTSPKSIFIMIGYIISFHGKLGDDIIELRDATQAVYSHGRIDLPRN